MAEDRFKTSLELGPIKVIPRDRWDVAQDEARERAYAREERRQAIMKEAQQKFEEQETKLSDEFGEHILRARTFDTGATRDQDTDKPDYSGFLSSAVIKRYGEYMHRHRKQADGTRRAADNWKRGIPLNVYMDSMFRHFVEVWSEHEMGPRTALGYPDKKHEALCALLFNVMGYLHESLKRDKP